MSLYPYKEGDLTVEEAKQPYYRCVLCDKVLNDEKDRHVVNGLIYCFKCK